MRFTLLDAEEVLTNYVKVWVQDFQLKSPVDRGVVPVGFDVIQGFLQSFQAGPKMPYQNKAPSIAVRMSHGSIHRVHPRETTVTLEIVVLTWDDDLSRQGYRDVANAIQAITTGIYETRILARSFPVTDDPVVWSLVEDPSKDYFPYFCGVIQVKLGMPIPDPNDAVYYPPGDQILTLKTKVPLDDPPNGWPINAK